MTTFLLAVELPLLEDQEYQISIHLLSLQF